MNIMKTNMLVLDNKIRKEDGENTSTVQAPVPQSTNPQAGMNALTFQGMKYLMENPEVAQEVGITNDESAESNAAKNSSNVAFKGNFKQIFNKNIGKLASLAAIATLLAACQKDPQIIAVPNTPNITNVYVTVTNEDTNAAINRLETVLLQMLAQNQLTYEEFVAYRKEMEAWKAQISNQLNNIYAALLSMGDKILDLDNGIDEHNAYQKMLIAMLQQQGYTNSQALELLQEAINIAKQNGKTVADGMAYLINQLNNIHSDLTTIIGQLDNAAKQREEQTNILYSMKLTGEATKEQVEALHANIIETNNILKDQGNKFLAQLLQLGSNVTDAIGELARINNCTRQDIMRGLAAIGVKIDNNTAAQYITSGVLSAQLQAALAKLDKLNADINKAKEEFKNDAAKYAEKVISLLEEIDATLSAFVSEWAEARNILFNKIDKLSNDVKKIYAEQKYQSGMMNVIHRDLNDVKQQMKADHILLQKVYEKIQNDPNSITKEDLETIAQMLGLSINTSIEALGNRIAKELAKNKEEIINNIDTKFGSLPTVNQEILELLQNIDWTDLSALKTLDAKLDDLIKAVNNIAGKIDNYANQALTAYGNVTNILNGIAQNTTDILAELAKIKSDINKANTELITVNKNLISLKGQIAQLEAKLGRIPTVEELDSIMTNHDKENQEFYANLIKKINIDPKDYTSALDYITELINILVTGQGKTNQYLLELLEWAKQHPDRSSEILALLKNGEFNIVVTCQCDCDKNTEVTEGYIHILGVKENKNIDAE